MYFGEETVNHTNLRAENTCFKVSFLFTS